MIQPVAPRVPHVDSSLCKELSTVVCLLDMSAQSIDLRDIVFGFSFQRIRILGCVLGGPEYLI